MHNTNTNKIPARQCAVPPRQSRPYDANRVQCRDNRQHRQEEEAQREQLSQQTNTKCTYFDDKARKGNSLRIERIWAICNQKGKKDQYQLFVSYARLFVRIRGAVVLQQDCLGCEPVVFWSERQSKKLTKRNKNNKAKIHAKFNVRVGLPHRPPRRA